MQIQDNGNDLEEGGDDFVNIDDMLLDELDLSGVQAAIPLVAPNSTASAMAATEATGCYDSYCDGCYNSQRPVAHGGCCDCSSDSTTKARPPEGLKGQRAQEEEAEGYGGGDTTATDN